MCRVLVHAFGVVHVHRTSSNLLEPHHHRENKVCRVLPPEFGVVRRCRTCSNLSYTGEARCAGCFCTSSGSFKRSEPPRTFLNHSMTELAGRVEFFHMSSGCTEPSLATYVQGKQGVQGARGRVRGGSRTSNLLETSRTIASQRYQGV